MSAAGGPDDWPELAYGDWADTAATLHMWTQVVGKVRMALTPPLNHWWHVPLYVNACGLTSSPIPDRGRSFEIVFDFLEQRLQVICTDGPRTGFDLEPMSVAQFYARLMALLAELGVRVRISTRPCEVPDPIPFEQDVVHHAYDGDAARRFWRILLNTQRVMQVYAGRFLGKTSPIHLFWGSLDLAQTRFSGRPAPPHPGSEVLPASVSQEAYSHEVASAGFWPGGGGEDALFYAYAYPEPAGYAGARVRPAAARYHPTLGEFILPYAEARRSPSPDLALLDFFQSTYDAAADLGRWPRQALERSPPQTEGP